MHEYVFWMSTLPEYSQSLSIRFMRVSSDLFPFASHGKYGYDLLFAKEELEVR